MAQQTFSDRLKAAMRSANMKQTDLIHAAEAFGFKLGKSQVSQYASGKTIPRPDVMAALAQTLNVPTSWLAEGKTREDNPPKPSRQPLQPSMATPQKPAANKQAVLL